PGGSGGGAGGSGGGAGGGGGQKPIDRCAAPMLDASLKAYSPAAGNRYARLTLTNISGHACKLFGFPGIGLANPQNPTIPASTRRGGTPRPFVVYPGGHAYTMLHWGVTPGMGEPDNGPCEPTPTALHVTPPDERSWTRASWTFGPVCLHGVFDVQPLSPNIPQPQ
ncbi:DUF4232 domain-containing protein, partial [Actinomadura logoneensis]